MKNNIIKPGSQWRRIINFESWLYAAFKRNIANFTVQINCNEIIEGERILHYALHYADGMTVDTWAPEEWFLQNYERVRNLKQ
jgi:hypothetical protein